MVKKRTDIYTQITNRIIKQLEQGIRPWHKPWDAENAAGRISRPLRHNGKPYSGINILILWDSAETQGFSCPIWLTFNQVKERKGHVGKGERSSPVVYSSSFAKEDKDENGEEFKREIPFLKQYNVFNAEQCEGLPDHFYRLKNEPLEFIEPIKQAVSFFQQIKADIREGGNRACYIQSKDLIQMPRIETFESAEIHAATLAHEMVHWTKHPARQNRELGRKRWGDEGYAIEELVAEIGAAFLCADLQITPEVRRDHADYISGWLKVLKEDKRAVFTAASMASKAVDFLHRYHSNCPRS